MRDFTFIKYRKMLEAAIHAGYHLAAYEDFVNGKTWVFGEPIISGYSKAMNLP